MSRARHGDSPETVAADPSVRDFVPGVEFIRGQRCEDVLPLLPAGVVDGCLTDPPYGLRIAPWDTDVPGPEVWFEILRLLKPGAPLIAFGGRRTFHRLGCAVEAAGFRVVDQGAWVYTSGRPPSRQHLKPSHEPILIARAPGPPLPVDIDAGRIPWRDEVDREGTARINTLRANGKRRAVYQTSLDTHGREPFVANVVGRWPSSVMATDEAFGEQSANLVRASA